MTSKTKTSPASLSPRNAQAEELKDLLRSAEEAQAEKALEAAASLAALPSRLAEAEEAHDAAAAHLRVIEWTYTNGDDSVPDAEYGDAVNAVRRTHLIAEGLRQRLKEAKSVNTSTDVAEAVAAVVPLVLGHGVPVVVTSLRESEARAILRTAVGYEPACVLISQTTPTRHAGYGHSDSGGVVAGTVDLRFLGRQQHMTSLRILDLKRKAESVGMNFGNLGGADAVNTFRVDVRSGHTGLPRLSDEGMTRHTELSKLSNKVASAVAHGVRLHNGSTQSVGGDGTFRSGIARTRADGATLVSAETVDGIRRAVVEVRVAVKLKSEKDIPVSARAVLAGADSSPARRATSYVERTLGNVEGVMVPFFGVVESSEVLPDGYHAEPITTAYGASDTSEAPIANGVRVRLTFVSAPR